MRTNLFLSTLFAVSLVAGAALAEKPTHERPGREPRAIQTLRIHGDTVDKSYVHADKSSHQANGSASARDARQNPLHDASSSRINCSDTGADCSRTARPAQTNHGVAGANHAQAQSSAKSPLKQNADSRMNCNEADECSASSKATQQQWASKGGGGNATVLTQRDAQPRLLAQASEARMSCNEADECMMSSKAAKKIWAVESVKAGTWHGGSASDQKPTKGEKSVQRSAEKRDREQTSADRQAVDHQAVDHQH